MKTRITRNDIKTFNIRLSIPYATLQSLLSYVEPIGYNAGIYGWNFDCYDIDGVLLMTGYRTIGKTIDRSIIKKYEKQADRLNSQDISYESKKKEALRLLNQFIDECRPLEY